ncbi:MAG: HAD family hydrolase [Clostridia bacterium]|nr:HAD family hydrolase [Clostridia bacterium]
MIKVAIFDLDGTLADTMGDLMTAMNGMLRELGFPTRTKEELLTFINNGAYRFVQHSLPEAIQEDELIMATALETYSRHYAKCYVEKTHAYAGIEEALRTLQHSNVRLAVLSNKQDEFVKNIIKKLFPADLFEEVHGQLEYPAKPDPTAALAIAKSMGVLPEECIFCGDSDVDIKTAKNAGMVPLGVSWGYRAPAVLREVGATLIARDPSDIPLIYEKYVRV